MAMKVLVAAGALAMACAQNMPATPTNGKFCAPDKFSGEFVLATKDFASTGNMTVDYTKNWWGMYQNGVTATGENVEGTYLQVGKHTYWILKEHGKTQCYKFRSQPDSESRCADYVLQNTVEIGGATGKLMRNVQTNSTGVVSYAATVSLRGDIVSYTNFTLATATDPGYLTTLKYFNTSLHVNPNNLIIPAACNEAEEIAEHPFKEHHDAVQAAHRISLFGKVTGHW